MAYSQREVLYSTESSFGAISTTYATSIPVIEVTSPPPDQQRTEDMSLQARQNETRPGYLSKKSATFAFKVYLCGHNTAPTGALTETWLADLLSDGLGAINTAGVGAVLNGSPTATSLPTAAGTFVAGALGRCGVKADSGGDGQGFVVTTGGTTGTLGVALPAAPSVGAQFYPMLTIYPTESPAGNTKRFGHYFATTGAQYHMWGCELSTVQIEIPPAGGIPTATFEYVVANWERTAVSFPVGTTVENCNAKPAAGGSMFYNAVGTTTRAVISPSSFKMTLDMGLAVKEGPATAQGAYQTINGYERTKTRCKVEIVVPWATGYETLFDTDGSSTTHQHLLYTVSATAGSAVALYYPRLYPIGLRPSSVTDYNGAAYQTVTFEAREGTTTTNDMTRSLFRIGLG